MHSRFTTCSSLEQLVHGLYIRSERRPTCPAYRTGRSVAALPERDVVVRGLAVLVPAIVIECARAREVVPRACVVLEAVERPVVGAAADTAASHAREVAVPLR